MLLRWSTHYLVASAAVGGSVKFSEGRVGAEARPARGEGLTKRAAETLAVQSKFQVITAKVISVMGDLPADCKRCSVRSSLECTLVEGRHIGQPRQPFPSCRSCYRDTRGKMISRVWGVLRVAVHVDLHVCCRRYNERASRACIVTRGWNRSQAFLPLQRCKPGG